MNQEEWLECWNTIRERFPEWKPTQVEREDYYLGLRVYKKEMIEIVGRWIKKTYSSTTPKLAWYIRESERIRKEDRMKNTPSDQSAWHLDKEQFDKEREAALIKLEQVPINDLRNATISILKKHGNRISKPENGNVRDWKQTLRGLVYCELFGKDQQ